LEFSVLNVNKEEHIVHFSIRGNHSPQVNIQLGQSMKIHLVCMNKQHFPELNSQPGLVIRRGKTNHSYNCFPIAPSPVASRTRAKMRVVKYIFFVCLFCFVCFIVWSRLMGQVWPAAIVVWRHLFI